MRNPVKTLCSDKELVEGIQEQPILVYITSTDEKLMPKIKSWEDSRLTDDKLYVATKFFSCFTLDEAALEKDDPLVDTLKKYKAPSFVVFHGGEVLYGSSNKPSASKLYSMLKKSASKIFGKSLDKPVKAALDLKREMDLLGDKKKELEKKMEGLDEKDRKLAKYQKQLEEVVKEETELKAKEAEIFVITPKAVAKK